MNQCKAEMLKFAAVAMGAINDTVDFNVEKQNNISYTIYKNKSETPNLGKYYFNTENGTCEWNPFGCNEQICEVARRLYFTIDFKKLVVYFWTDGYTFYESFAPESKNDLNYIVMKCAAEIGKWIEDAVDFHSGTQTPAT